MKKVLILFPFLLFIVSSYAQTVPSSCEAPDSVVALYRPGADILALQEIYNRNLSDKDSLYIAKPWSDTILHALIAVYNATTLPARDSVVDMYYIIRPASPTLNQIKISADTSLAWVHNFKNGVIPTGYTAIDSIINLVPLSLTGYNSAPYFQYATAYFQSPVDFNVQAVDTFLMTLPDVHHAGQIFDEIYYRSLCDTIYADHIGLTYEYRWGDCESGCINHHFWKFNVYHDCSVEYKGSYGDPINPTGVNNLVAAHGLQIFPNPARETLTIDVANGIYTSYTITNIMGIVMAQAGITKTHTAIDVHAFTPGVYYISIQGNEGRVVQNFIKL